MSELVKELSDGEVKVELSQDGTLTVHIPLPVHKTIKEEIVGTKVENVPGQKRQNEEVDNVEPPKHPHTFAELRQWRSSHPIDPDPKTALQDLNRHHKQ